MAALISLSRSRWLEGAVSVGRDTPFTVSQLPIRPPLAAIVRLPNESSLMAPESVSHQSSITMTTSLIGL